MNPKRRPLRRLGLGIAIALAIPGFVAAEQDHRYKEPTASNTTQQQRDTMDAQRADRTDMSTAKANMNRQPITDRPDQSATDARREGIVWTSFELNDQLRHSDLDVEVRSGRAILTGTVESEVERNLAEHIAQSVDGINRVDNRIRVDRNAHRSDSRTVAAGGERDFATTMADATTTAKVKSKLLWNSRTDGLDIDVDTKRGEVTLTGTADTEQAKQLAERIARDTDGVSMVHNRLTLQPDRGVAMSGDRSRDMQMRDRDAMARDTRMRDDRDAMTRRETDTFESDFERSAARDADMARDDMMKDTTAATDPARERGAMMDRDGDMADMERPDGWITTKVKSTLLFSRSVDGFAIDVDTRNGVVQLSGTVDSPQQKQLAVDLARDVVGVRSVDASKLTAATEASVAGTDNDE